MVMYEFHVIGRIHTDLPEKFGVPRQSGLAENLTGRIVMEPQYRDRKAFEGIEEFGYLWLLWRFDVPESEGFRSQVRPPRLGGNEYRGVFATRSPFRPNPIGLSCVKLVSVEEHPELGPVITVAGVDMRDGTEILDIKPYLAYADAHPEAGSGFADATADYGLEVRCDESLLACMAEDKREALLEVLRQDPRPSYQDDPDRVYGMSYAGMQVRFRVRDGILQVVEIAKGDE